MSEGRREVAFLDLGATYQELKPELDDAHGRVMQSGWFVLGSELEAFEREFATYVAADHAVGVGNGLDALTLALRALDIGSGDEVIVPSNTYIATWLAVSAVGAVPVPVEPDSTTYNLDAIRISEAITQRTRAILPVHLYGQPANLGAILEVASDHGLRVVEDAAQAHGASCGGSRIGAAGDVVCWSFYPGKNLGAFGDGGAITTRSAELAQRVRVLRNYGSKVKYEHDTRGVNSRLDELQAAFLRVKLRHLDTWNARRAAIAQRYLEALADHPTLGLPWPQDGAESSWHLFVVRHAERDRLRAHLADAGVASLIHYPIPPHRQLAYQDLEMRTALPLAEQLADEVLSLPIGPHLPEADVTHVIDTLRRF